MANLDSMMASSASALMKEFDNTGKPAFPPLVFWNTLKQVFPNFAEKD